MKMPIGRNTPQGRLKELWVLDVYHINKLTQEERLVGRSVTRLIGHAKARRTDLINDYERHEKWAIRDGRPTVSYTMRFDLYGIGPDGYIKVE